MGRVGQGLVRNAHLATFPQLAYLKQSGMIETSKNFPILEEKKQLKNQAH